MTCVIIADPDPTSRNALFLWLAYKLEIDEIIQVSDGESLIAQLENETPNLILMDWTLPNRPAPELCLELQKRFPFLQWVILSIDGEVSWQAKKYSGWFIQKGSSPEDVFLLLQQVIGNSV